MRSTAAFALGLFFAMNGAAMLALPRIWYQLVPGVALSGPFNPHFVADVGLVYLVAGVTFILLARSEQSWPAALTGAAFVVLHAGVHVLEFAQGKPHAILFEWCAVIVPAVLALLLALAAMRRSLHRLSDPLQIGS